MASGKQTRFWHDCWLGECPLKIQFHSLFQISSNPNIEVAKVFVNGQWDIQFRRQLHESQIEEWCRLQSLLEGINLNNDRDRVHWALEKSKTFTV